MWPASTALTNRNTTEPVVRYRRTRHADNTHCKYWNPTGTNRRSLRRAPAARATASSTPTSDRGGTCMWRRLTLPTLKLHLRHLRAYHSSHNHTEIPFRVPVRFGCIVNRILRSGRRGRAAGRGTRAGTDNAGAARGPARSGTVPPVTCILLINIDARCTSNVISPHGRQPPWDLSSIAAAWQSPPPRVAHVQR